MSWRVIIDILNATVISIVIDVTVSIGVGLLIVVLSLFDQEEARAEVVVSLRLFLTRHHSDRVAVADALHFAAEKDQRVVWLLLPRTVELLLRAATPARCGLREIKRRLRCLLVFFIAELVESQVVSVGSICAVEPGVQRLDKLECRTIQRVFVGELQCLRVLESIVKFIFVRIIIAVLLHFWLLKASRSLHNDIPIRTDIEASEGEIAFQFKLFHGWDEFFMTHPFLNQALLC